MTHNYLIADRSAPHQGLPPGSRLLRIPRGQIRSSPFYSFALVWLCLFAVMQAQAQFPGGGFPGAGGQGANAARRSSTRTYRSEEHTSELQSHHDLVCRLLLEKKK